jgi:hypothetical protein
MATAVTEQSTPKADPELLRQITAAQNSKNPVVGIFRLRPEDSDKLTNSPERTKEIVHEVVERVSTKIGSSPQRINVLGNLGVVIVSAAPRFLTELLKQPEIFSAMANESSEGGKIEPINKRRVPESAIDKSVNGKNARQSKSDTNRYKSRTTTNSRMTAKKAAKKR